MKRLRIQLKGSLPWNPVLISEAIEELFPKREFLPHDEAREFVRKLKLKNYKEWRQWCGRENRPSNLPSCPQYTYKDEWIGWGDFLGTGATNRRRNRTYSSFGSVKKYIQVYNISTFRGWVSYWFNNKKPFNIPYNPQKIYKDEWRGWPDFLCKSK